MPESIVIERAALASPTVRDFIQQAYPAEQDAKTTEERYIHATSTRLNTCILDAWADADLYPADADPLAGTVAQVLWNAALTHPTYPLPGKDESATELITHLTDCLVTHVSYLDAPRLLAEADHAARLVSLWCENPPLTSLQN
jgi:hypothetical protein